MTIPTWPVTLPEIPLSQGFKEGPPNLLLRTQMDQGPAKVRKRFSAGPRPVTLNVQLHQDQVEILDTFYLDALEGGSLRFSWAHPRTRVAKEFRFEKPPEYAHIGGLYYMAVLPLEILP
jgi:hypothetical protein